MRGASRESLTVVREMVERLTSADRPAALRELAGEIFSLVHLLGSEARLRRIVSDPAVEPDQRAALLSGLVAGRVSDRAREVAETLARSAWATPRDLVDAADDAAVQALFIAEERDDALDDVEDELFRFNRVLEGEPRLRSALTDPSLPTDRKADLLGELLSGKVRESTLSLIREVVLHPRGRTIDRGLEDYARAAAARRERLVARVTSVLPLGEAQLTRLAEGLATELGHEVHLNVEIDPDLVGGLTVRVGDELFDGSIVHRLTTARRLMAG